MPEPHMATPDEASALAEAERAFERCAGTPYGHSVHVTDETRTIVRRALREMREGNAALRDLAARVAELEASGGVAAIAAERQRQISEEGWTAEHDDQWISDELAIAAVCYLRHDPALCAPEAPPDWPWDESWWKPKRRRDDLVRAGALIAAEIDRLDRVSDHAALGEGGGDG